MYTALVFSDWGYLFYCLFRFFSNNVGFMMRKTTEFRYIYLLLYCIIRHSASAPLLQASIKRLIFPVSRPLFPAVFPYKNVQKMLKIISLPWWRLNKVDILSDVIFFDALFYVFVRAITLFSSSADHGKFRELSEEHKNNKVHLLRGKLLRYVNTWPELSMLSVITAMKTNCICSNITCNQL